MESERLCLVIERPELDPSRDLLRLSPLPLLEKTFVTEFRAREETPPGEKTCHTVSMDAGAGKTGHVQYGYKVVQYIYTH